MEFETSCACITLRRAARAVTAAYDAALAPSGLRITQFSILRRLARLGPAAQASDCIQRLTEAVMRKETFFMLLLAAGAFSFLRIGQKEDPDFTFRIMVVQVLWPGRRPC